MRFLIGMTATAASALAWGAAMRAYYHRGVHAEEVHYARTKDGWGLALSRYRPTTPRFRHPVVLCHGLAANRFAFDLREDRSLARWLAREGFDVFVLELRGHGLSDHPGSGSGKTWGWSFDDYLERDLPTALERVRALTDVEGAHWVGHSMGGILLYAHLARNAPTGAAGVVSGVTIGSALTYEGTSSDFHTLRRAVGLARALPMIPAGALGMLGAPLSGRFSNPMERFNYWPPNMEPDVARQLHAVGFHGVSSPVLVQLSTAFDPDGLRDEGGHGAPFAPRLGTVKTPLLSIIGTEDRQCSPEAAARTLAAAPQAPTQLRAFGRAHGHETEYGHFDLLLGPRAEREVFGVVRDWLARHDEGS